MRFLSDIKSIQNAIRIDFISLKNLIELLVGGDAMIDIGERLQQLMDERGLNMYSLAKRSGLSWNTIKNFYSRQSKPTVTTISMLCDGLGITLSQFFEEDSDNAHLTAEQQHLINRWNQLTDKEKQTISDTIDLILGQHK